MGDTAAMDDLIVNSVALGFISSIDELFFATLTKDAVKYMMGNIQKYDLFDCEAEETMTDQQCLEWHSKSEKSHPSLLSKLWGLLPMRLCIASSSCAASSWI